MIRVVLKGVHKTRKKLADGTIREYYYAWKGGPRLDGKPGSPEFVAVYQEAVKGRENHTEQTLNRLVFHYKNSPAYLDLKPITRKDYNRYIKVLEQEFEAMPLPETDKDYRIARMAFLDWRDSMADRPRTADMGWAVLKTIMQYGVDRGFLSHNPCQGGRKLWRGSRRDNIWTDDLIEVLYSHTPREVIEVCKGALETGQRQGDILALQWSAFDGQRLCFQQSKTGARVSILLTQEFALHLRGKKRVSTFIFTNSKGQPWTNSGFQTAFDRAKRRTGIKGLTFHDFRGTAVCRAAQTTGDIAALASRFGWSLASVNSILDRHYLSPDQQKADQIVRSLEAKRRTKTPNRLQTAQKIKG